MGAVKSKRRREGRPFFRPWCGAHRRMQGCEATYHGEAHEAEEEDEDDMNGTMEARADAAKAATRARRQREAQMRKRPMVAGQRKPRRRFEQKSLAHFTVLRSALSRSAAS